MVMVYLLKHVILKRLYWNSANYIIMQGTNYIHILYYSYTLNYVSCIILHYTRVYKIIYLFFVQYYTCLYNMEL